MTLDFRYVYEKAPPTTKPLCIWTDLFGYEGGRVAIHPDGTYLWVTVRGTTEVHEDDRYAVLEDRN